LRKSGRIGTGTEGGTYGFCWYSRGAGFFGVRYFVDYFLPVWRSDFEDLLYIRGSERRGLVFDVPDSDFGS
jgi:hypothetical protein